MEYEDSSSPSSCVTDDGKSKKRIMATPRARDASVTIRYPMLEGENCSVRAAKMKIFMRSHGVRATVEEDDDEDPRLFR